MNDAHQRPESLHQVIGRPRSARAKRVLRIAGALLVAWVVFFAFSGPDENKNAPRYVTAPVARGDLTVTVAATGTLAPVNQVDVGSEISGTIQSVAVDFNDRVQRGQVLAKLDTSELEARVVQMRAALEGAQARVRQAQATALETRLKFQRCKDLAERGWCARQDLDTLQAAHSRAQADEAAARAQVAQTRATLDAELTRLRKAAIRSPINGVVLKRQIEPGQTVAASLQTPVLFTLAENLKQMELRVAVDEADVGKVSRGQRAVFNVDAYPQREFNARIEQVRQAPQTVQGVVTYETILSVDNADLALRPGMTATAQIVVNELQDAILIPNAALRFTPPPPSAGGEDGDFMSKLFPRMGRRPQQNARDVSAPGKQSVWALQVGRPTEIEVQVGASDGRHTQLLAGQLAPGAQLITDVETASPRGR